MVVSCTALMNVMTLDSEEQLQPFLEPTTVLSIFVISTHSCQYSHIFVIFCRCEGVNNTQFLDSWVHAVKVLYH